MSLHLARFSRPVCQARARLVEGAQM